MAVQNRVFEIKTIKGVVLKNLFEVVKQYIKETNFVVGPGGLEISSIDSSENSITFVKLDAQKFESFESKRVCVFGIDTVVLYKTIKSCNKREIVTMYMNEGEEESFYIELSDIDIGKRKVYKIPVLDLPVGKVNAQDIEYSSVMNMSTSQFQQIVKDIGVLDGRIVEIKSIGKRLILSCTDGVAEFKTTINEDVVETGKESLIKFLANSENIVQGRFKVSYLTNFIKASHLCENMNILLSNDSPLTLEYYVADLGILRLMLIPFTE